jgi:hypothetical protein
MGKNQKSKGNTGAKGSYIRKFILRIKNERTNNLVVCIRCKGPRNPLQEWKKRRTENWMV